MTPDRDGPQIAPSSRQVSKPVAICWKKASDSNRCLTTLHRQPKGNRP
jgi:hypothetical protein